MKKIVISMFVFIFCVMSVDCKASPVPYSLYGTDDLEVYVTSQDNSWPAYKAIDGYFNLYDGWWNEGTDLSIMFAFKAGTLSVDKIQMYTGTATLSHTMERCHLYYTTDANPNLSSTFMPLTGLTILNDVDATITANEIYMNEAINEVLVAFDAVEATGIRILDHSDPVGGDDNRYPGRTVYNEVTIDEGVSAIPEPASLLTLLLGLISLYRIKRNAK